VKVQTLIPRYLEGGPDIFVCAPTRQLLPEAERVARALAEEGWAVEWPLVSKRLGSQITQAVKDNAWIAVIVGDPLVVKDLQHRKQRSGAPLDELLLWADDSSGLFAIRPSERKS